MMTSMVVLISCVDKLLLFLVLVLYYCMYHCTIA